MAQGGLAWPAGISLVGVVLVGTLLPGAAAACVVLPLEPTLRGFPADGAGDVPTDVVPFYDWRLARIGDLEQSSFRVSTVEGDVIPLRAQHDYVETFQLFPEQPLEPHTTYTLTALAKATLTQTFEEAVTFTTGSGPVEVAPAAPDARLEHVTIDNPTMSSCGGFTVGTCLAQAGQLPFEVTYIDDDGLEGEPYLYEEARFAIDLSQLEDQHNLECVRLRTRAANATFSEPVVLCGPQAPLFGLETSDGMACTAEGLTQNGALVRDAHTQLRRGAKKSQGCHVSSASPGSRSVALFGLLLAAFASRARRGRL